MDFASSHIYNYDYSDEECVSEEELEEGLAPERLMDAEDSAQKKRRSSPIPEEEDSLPSTDHKAESKPGFLGGLLNSLLFAATNATPQATTSRSEKPPPAPPRCPISANSRHRKKLSATENAESQGRGNATGSEAAAYKTGPAGVRLPGRTWRRADTNVVSIKFDCLTAPSNMHAGDPEYCSGCKAVLAHLSKVLEEGEDKVWCCEFCGERNVVDLVKEEIPSKDDTTYMLQPAPSTTASGRSGTDESLVIFCVDISGSMCVTTEVPGKVRLRGSERLARLQSLNDTRESQFLPGQRCNVTYVSRLQGVQAAVDHQLGEMQKDHPHRRVSLITFNNEVTAVGDGSKPPVHLSGDKLSDWDALLQAGAELGLPQAVTNSRKTLGDRVFELEEGGATALGPALLVSVAMASQVPGSKVIICTDGRANVGLGSLEHLDKQDAYEKAVAFYSQVSTLTAEKGVSVSVISIKGTDCRMVELGKVADATGGQVNIVDPLKLTQEFGTILSDPIIATNVTATFLLHKGLYIRHGNSEDSKIVRYVGNVTAETEITFEFGVRHPVNKPKTEKPEESTADASAGAEGGDPDNKKSPDYVSLDNLKELPFQLQIVYTDLEGAQALRVVSQAKPVTRDRDLAERNMKISVMGVHTAQQSAQMALLGEYTSARLSAHSSNRLVEKYARRNKSTRPQYEAFYNNISPMEQQLNKIQRRERSSHGCSYSDDEEEDSAGPTRRKAGVTRRKAGLTRRKECDDDTATMMYQNLKVRSKDFKK